VQQQYDTIEFKIETKACPNAYDTINKAINGIPYHLVFLGIRLSFANSKNQLKAENRNMCSNPISTKMSLF